MPSVINFLPGEKKAYWHGYAVFQECQGGSDPGIHQHSVTIIDKNTATVEIPTVAQATGMVSPESENHFSVAVARGLLPAYVNEIVSAGRSAIRVMPGIGRPKKKILKFPQSHRLSGSDVFEGFNGADNPAAKPIMFPVGPKTYLLWILVDTAPGMSVERNYENCHSHAFLAHRRVEAMQADWELRDQAARRHYQKQTGKRHFESLQQGAKESIQGAVAGMSGAFRFNKKSKREGKSFL